MSEKNNISENEQKKLKEEELENPTGGAFIPKSGNDITINSGDTVLFKPVNVGGKAGPQIMTAPRGANLVPAPFVPAQNTAILKDIQGNDNFYFDPDTGDKGDK